MVIPNIDDTITLIKHLHAGQIDRIGKPYFEHPLRVAANLKSIFPACDDDMVMAAMLHDTIEDCDIDESYLRAKGYSEKCIKMIVLVTKSPNDSRNYEEVINNLITHGNKGAILIKIADNMDNLHPKRVSHLKQLNPKRGKQLANRYHYSVKALSKAAGINEDHIFSLINQDDSKEGSDYQKVI